MNTKQTVSKKGIVSSYYQVSRGRSRVLRDAPHDASHPMQSRYLNEVMGFFLRALIQVYAPTELSEKTKADLRRYLDRIIEAKDAVDGKSGGKIY